MLENKYRPEQVVQLLTWEVLLLRRNQPRGPCQTLPLKRDGLAPHLHKMRGVGIDEDSSTLGSAATMSAPLVQEPDPAEAAREAIRIADLRAEVRRAIAAVLRENREIAAAVAAADAAVAPRRRSRSARGRGGG